MRSHITKIILVMTITVALISRDSRAQTASALGTCTGALTGSLGLAVTLTDGNLRSISTEQIATAFGAAECTCDTRDIYLQVQLTRALPVTPALNFQIWLGNNCLDYATRSSTTTRACEDVTGLSGIVFGNFTTSSTTVGPILIPISARKLFTPGPPNTCGSPLQFPQNDVFLLFFSDPMSLIASCQLNLNQAASGPTGAQNITADGGDSAVTVNWSAPSTSSAGQPIAYYQMLCANDTGAPVFSEPKAALYSVCLDGVIKRRNFSGSNLTNVSFDAGVTSDASAVDANSPMDAAVDMSTVDASDGSADGGAESALSSLDPRFVCSDRLDATQRSLRVQGLTNGKTYQFSVLAIDAYGNATPSAVVTAKPIPTEDLYRRYYNAGGRASGFCFIATAAYGSYEHRFVRILRDFRDDILQPTFIGRHFIDWYYAHSPASAQFISERPAIRIAVQILLWPVIVLAGVTLLLVHYQWIWLVGIVGWLLRRQKSNRLGTFRA